MKNEKNPLHLKLNYEEGKNAKKSILSSEIALLKINKFIENYKKLRIQELENKEKINSNINSIKIEITKLNKLLPQPKIPKILQKHGNNEEINKTISPEIKKYGTAEDELIQIQEKLKLLEEN